MLKLFNKEIIGSNKALLFFRVKNKPYYERRRNNMNLFFMTVSAIVVIALISAIITEAICVDDEYEDGLEIPSFARKH